MVERRDAAGSREQGNGVRSRHPRKLEESQTTLWKKTCKGNRYVERGVQKKRVKGTR